MAVARFVATRRPSMVNVFTVFVSTGSVLVPYACTIPLTVTTMSPFVF
jgi:hypothetical protein